MWIAVDLDGTLATYTGQIHAIGEPIPLMVERVKAWLAKGQEVRILTARMSKSGAVGKGGVGGTEEFVRMQEGLIRKWTVKHLGVAVRATCEKDFKMLELWDDRAICVEFNTGVIIGGKTDAL